MSNSPTTTMPIPPTENESENEYEYENEYENEYEKMSNSPTTTLPTPPTPPTENENENENYVEDTKVAIIKVTNQSITRRFTMPTEKPTWSELQSKVREVFSIPSSVAPGLTYIDEEDDVIALSSQAELEDYYKQVNKVKEYDSSETVYKFNLVIFVPMRDDSNDDNKNNVSDYEENEVQSYCPTQ